MKKALLFLILALQWPFFSKSQSIQTPVFVQADLNNSGQFLCLPATFIVRFQAQNFNTGNQFTVQLSNEAGDFSAPLTIGQLVDTGGNALQITCNIPGTVAAGAQYRFRISGSDPVAQSSPNQFPFSLVSPLPAGLSPDDYGTDRWIAHVHTWNSLASVVTDAVANSLNFFNPARYVARFEMDSLSFNMNFGLTAPGRGTPPLQNFLGCTNPNNFSIRFKRRIFLDSGYYSFRVTGDDGFRLSTDGGSTWLIRSWRQQNLTTTCHNNCCGVFLTAGLKNLVLEYFDRFDEGSISLTIEKAGPPGLIDDPSGLDGSTICANRNPFFLNLTPPGGIFTGVGVTPNGFFSPDSGSTGPRIITYRTGITPCMRIRNITVNISPGPVAKITNLDSVYCLTAAPVLISATPSGGTFLPIAGLIGNSFNPAVAGIGVHTIRYAVPDIGGSCPDTAVRVIEVKQGIAISVQSSDSVVCQNGPPISLSGIPAGGAFSGTGVTGSVFNPAGLQAGLYQLQYAIPGAQSCGDSVFNFKVRVKEKPIAQISGLDSVYCTSQGPVNILVSPTGGILSGSAGVLGNTFNPSAAGLGIHVIKYIIPNSGSTCSDTAEWVIRVRLGLPVSAQASDSVVCQNGQNISLTGSPAGGIFQGPGVAGSTFAPSGLSPGLYLVQYKVTGSQTCGDSTAVVRVRVKAKPNANFSGLPASVCFNSGPIGLIPQQKGGSFFGAGVSDSTFNVQNIPSASSASVSYRIVQNGCIDSTSQTVLIERPQPPAVSLSGFNPRYCSADPAFTLNALPAGGILFANGRKISNTISPSDLGTGLIQLKYAFKPSSACLDTLYATGQFTITESPRLVGLQDVSLELGSSVQLSVSGAATYRWTPETGLSNPNIANPIASPTQSTLYTVEGKDISGFCSSEASMTIGIFENLFVPTLITANGDGKNDKWEIQGLKTRKIRKIEIFDRWGKRIFETTDGNALWDGKVKGEVRTGTFFYFINFEGSEEITGFLTVTN